MHSCTTVMYSYINRDNALLHFQSHVYMYMYISGIVINLTDLVMNQARDATVVVDWLVRGELDDQCFP